MIGGGVTRSAVLTLHQNLFLLKIDEEEDLLLLFSLSNTVIINNTF
jgi:hypothetical protein